MTVGTCDPNTGVGSPRPFFIGGSARQAFRSALGAGVVWTDSLVPLEGDGACFNGTRDGHPSESIFVSELMTGYIDPTSNPLSAVSASFLRDLGLQVNDLAVDPYTVPWGLPALRMHPPPLLGRRGSGAGAGHQRRCGATVPEGRREPGARRR